MHQTGAEKGVRPINVQNRSLDEKRTYAFGLSKGQ
jgi:hypothetical protein